MPPCVRLSLPPKTGSQSRAADASPADADDRADAAVFVLLTVSRLASNSPRTARARAYHWRRSPVQSRAVFRARRYSSMTRARCAAV